MTIDRCCCGRAICALVVVACAGTMSRAAFGQSPVVDGSDTGWVLAPAGGAVANPYSIYLQTGQASAPTESHSTLAHETLARMGLNAGVTHDGAAPTDEFRYALSYRRDFRISESSTINLSNMLDGFFDFNGGVGANNIPAGMTAELTVLVRNAQGVYVPTGIEGTLTVPGSAANLPGRTGVQVVNNFLRLSGGTLNVAQGDQYRVVATLRIESAGQAGTVVGSRANIDTRSAPRAGQAATFAVLPLGYSGDSRAAVLAGAAAEYGVSGRNIRVGMVESNPYAHDSLAGRVVVRNGPFNAGEQQRNEHALAVAGIMAGRSDVAQARGLAPDATVYSAGVGTWGSGRAILSDLLSQGVSVVNLSIGFSNNVNPGDFSAPGMDRWVTSNPLMTIVAAAGNDGPPQPGGTTVTPPATSNSVITVGAVNRDFTRRAEFSSYSSGDGGRRPDLVAPGEYILAPGQRDGDGNGRDDDFRRNFIGSDFDAFAVSPSTGAITGTSFAAPFVSGTVALLHDYARTHAQTHDATAIDSRVMRAVLMNTASTAVTRSNGGAWSQDAVVGPMPGHAGQTTLVVTRSGDEQLGGGLLNVRGALEMYARAEVRAADDAAAQNVRIDVTGGAAVPNVPMFWDRQAIRWSTQAGGLGTVEYTLGLANQGWHFRATLAWIEETLQINGRVVNDYSQLNIGLFRDTPGDGNPAGFDPANPTADLLITGTNEASATTRMLDITIPANGSYYLLVVNQSGLPAGFSAPIYGLSVYIPAPGGASVLAAVGLLALRRRR